MFSGRWDSGKLLPAATGSKRSWQQLPQKLGMGVKVKCVGARSWANP